MAAPPTKGVDHASPPRTDPGASAFLPRRARRPGLDDRRLVGVRARPHRARSHPRRRDARRSTPKRSPRTAPSCSPSQRRRSRSSSSYGVDPLSVELISRCSMTHTPWTAPDVRRDRRRDARRSSRPAPAAPGPATARRADARGARGSSALLIRTYRQTVLVWCGQAMRAASPLAFSNMPPAQPNPFRAVGWRGDGATDRSRRTGAAIELARQQSTRTAASTASSWPRRTPTRCVEHWRLAARAAALAEHDTASEVAAQMTAPQAQALVGDVAAITQALVVLDQRYKNTPGWEPLAQSARLGWAALAAALDVNLGQPDYTVDHLGWRPKTKIIDRPGAARDPRRPAGEHNLVIRMKSVPNATNLRLRRRLPTPRCPRTSRRSPRGSTNVSPSVDRTRRDLLRRSAGAPRDRRAARKGRTAPWPKARTPSRG